MKHYVVYKNGYLIGSLYDEYQDITSIEYIKYYDVVSIEKELNEGQEYQLLVF